MLSEGVVVSIDLHPIDLLQEKKAK